MKNHPVIKWLIVAAILILIIMLFVFVCQPKKERIPASTEVDVQVEECGDETETCVEPEPCSPSPCGNECEGESTAEEANAQAIEVETPANIEQAAKIESVEEKVSDVQAKLAETPEQNETAQLDDTFSLEKAESAIVETNS